MAKKVNIDASTFRILYYRYKDFLIPVGTIFGCLLLFFLVIIPQIQNWFVLQGNIAVEKEKLATLSLNVHFLSTLSPNVLASELATANAALPGTKDFAGIINSLSQAAGATGVGLSDYSFQVGDVNGTAPVQGSVFTLQIALGITGDMRSTAKFIRQLKSQLPLADVTDATIRPSSGTSLTALFYYFPYPKITISPEIAISPLSPAQVKLLSTLQSWQTPVTPQANQSSTSAKLQ